MIEIVNENNVSVLLPRKYLLGNIEFSCMMVGKVSTNWQVSDAQGNDIIKVDKNSDLNVDAEFKIQLLIRWIIFQIFSRPLLKN